MSATGPDTDYIKQAINEYLSSWDMEGLDEPGRLAELTKALDNLVAQFHRTSDIEPSTDELEAPSFEYQPLAKRASAAFPSLGYYADVEPELLLDQEITLGDAIDDLADIARDLQKVLWYIDADKNADAIWHFRLGYRTHWGDHLHRLRNYLHRIYSI